MKVLVACEFSGIVRDAFLARGHDAWSCDLLPSERIGPHIQDDVLKHLEKNWDLMLAFPPCTYLCSSGLHWNKKRPERNILTAASFKFFMALVNVTIPKVALENPIGYLSTHYRKPDQIIQPWQFGEDASKATCLWLKGLPLLRPTKILPGGRFTRRANQSPDGQNKLWSCANRAIERSRTYFGIADAMAEQWGKLEV